MFVGPFGPLLSIRLRSDSRVPPVDGENVKTQGQNICENVKLHLKTYVIM
jgi:hypothetical protein